MLRELGQSGVLSGQLSRGRAQFAEVWYEFTKIVHHAQEALQAEHVGGGLYLSDGSSFLWVGLESGGREYVTNVCDLGDPELAPIGAELEGVSTHLPPFVN